MAWMRDNWDKVLNTALAVFGAGGIVAFLSDFMAMCLERPWQAIFLAVLCLSIGYALGLCNRPAAKARRERRRDEEFERELRERNAQWERETRERMEREEHERMMLSIARMNRTRMRLVLVAIVQGSVTPTTSEMPQARVLCREGYLESDEPSDSGQEAFSPPTWMVDMARDGDRWQGFVKKHLNRLKSGEVI